jgi:hypothetical protein
MMLPKRNGRWFRNGPEKIALARKWQPQTTALFLISREGATSAEASPAHTPTAPFLAASVSTSS